MSLGFFFFHWLFNIGTRFRLLSNRDSIPPHESWFFFYYFLFVSTHIICNILGRYWPGVVKRARGYNQSAYAYNNKWFKYLYRKYLKSDIEIEHKKNIENKKILSWIIIIIIICWLYRSWRFFFIRFTFY